MCLWKVDERENPYAEGVGYKLFGGDFNGKLEGWIMHEFLYEIGETYEAVEEDIRSSGGEWYKSGFHIFLNKEDAIALSRFLGIPTDTLVEVSWKGQKARGREGMFGQVHPVVVAQTMTLKRKIPMGEVDFIRINIPEIVD